MFQSFITVFREILEIIILLSIFLFSTKDIKNRSGYILTGFVLGIISSIGLAIFAVKLTSMFYGNGQEILNIIIISLSIFMISWAVIWMSKNSKNLHNKIQNVSTSITQGTTPKLILSLFIAVTILREGAEIIMFIGGILASGESLFSVLTGSIGGLLAGTLLGTSIYFGFLKISNKIIFKVTSLFLIILASGLAARLANMLSQAEFIDILSAPLWNSSWLIKDNSFMGIFLNNILGYYNSSPSAIEVIFYIAIFISLFMLSGIKICSKK